MKVTSPITQELTTSEVIQFDELEAVIDRGIKTFTEVGTALLAIRDAKLYRIEHKTFDDYCKNRWGIKKQAAYQLMSGAEVAANLKSHNCDSVPVNQAQTRPLAKLDPSDQPKVWEAATEKAESEGRTVTAKDVEEQVEIITQPEQTVDSVQDDAGTVPATQKLRPIGPPCDGMQFARIAIMNLDQIKETDTERDQALSQIIEYCELKLSSGAAGTKNKRIPALIESAVNRLETEIRLCGGAGWKRCDRQELASRIKSILKKTLPPSEEK